MNRPPLPGESPASPPLFTVLSLLWLAGATIRIPLLAVPPVIPLIHDDLHMSETQVGLLIGIPLSMFALAAIPGSLLIARFGVLVVATCGLAIATLASAARAAVTDIWTLYAATLVMGFGVAIFQPAFPTLVRIWSPGRAWLANAVSTNGMLMGVTFTAALSIPVVLPLVGQSWRYDLLVWSVPGLVTTASMAPACARGAGNDGRNPNGAGCTVEDLCAEGWHVCRGASELTTLSVTCAEAGIPAVTTGSNGAMFFATRQRGMAPMGCVPDATTGSNNLHGCGNFGRAEDPGCNPPLDRQIESTVCATTPPWACSESGTTMTEATVVTKSSSAAGGVLCCH